MVGLSVWFSKDRSHPAPMLRIFGSFGAKKRMRAAHKTIFLTGVCTSLKHLLDAVFAHELYG
jgi:hypothetical protein